MPQRSLFQPPPRPDTHPSNQPITEPLAHTVRRPLGRCFEEDVNAKYPKYMMLTSPKPKYPKPNTVTRSGLPIPYPSPATPPLTGEPALTGPESKRGVAGRFPFRPSFSASYLCRVGGNEPKNKPNGPNPVSQIDRPTTFVFVPRVVHPSQARSFTLNILYE